MTAVDKNLKDDCKELCRGLGLKQIWLPFLSVIFSFILSLRHYKNDAFSSRPERPGYKAKKKNAPSFYFAAIRSFNSIEVPSSRGGRSEAQHNAPRQGSAMPTRGVPDH